MSKPRIRIENVLRDYAKMNPGTPWRSKCEEEAADEIQSLRQRVERLEGENERLRSEAAAMWRGGVSNTVAVADRVRNRFAKGLRLKKNQRLAQFDAELDAALGDWFDKTRAARPASYNESEDLFRAALSPKVQEGE